MLNIFKCTLYIIFLFTSHTYAQGNYFIFEGRRTTRFGGLHVNGKLYLSTDGRVAALTEGVELIYTKTNNKFYIETDTNNEALIDFTKSKKCNKKLSEEFKSVGDGCWIIATLTGKNHEYTLIKDLYTDKYMRTS